MTATDLSTAAPTAEPATAATVSPSSPIKPTAPAAPSTVVPRPAIDRRSLAERVRADGTRFILATFVDLNGKPCAKLVPVEAVDELETAGVGFAGYAAGLLGQTPADPDIIVLPDASSYCPIPFVRPGLAMVQCDPYVLGEPWPYAPRHVLRAAVGRLAGAGLTASVGAEIEYFLIRRDDTGALRPADDLDRSSQPCYDARGVTRMYEHLSAVSSAMNSLGWGNYANDHEDGNGQFEQNFVHADPLTTADRVISLRYIIHMLAEQRGMTATFMPKPFGERTGSGMHIHLSLWRDGRPEFPHPADGRGLGLSPLAYAAIAGVLDHSPAFHAFAAPTVNSYKRLGARSTTSGASWAPKSATYGGNDRTHYIRVPDDQRIEIRGGDGSANPYLLIAGALTAGLDGIERSLDPGEPGRPDGASGASAARPFPRTLVDAVAALESDPVMRSVLDASTSGDAVSRYYCDRKREEFYAWHDQVSAWELDTYLTAV